MAKKRVHFERFGSAYMPCTVVGWGYLFALIILMFGCVFLVDKLWAITGWPGSGLVNFLTLSSGVIAINRFAHNRSPSV